jgi:hypothetical protein
MKHLKLLKRHLSYSNAFGNGKEQLHASVYEAMYFRAFEEGKN